MLIRKTIAAIVLVSVFSFVCYAAEPSVSAECAVLMCAQTGEVLYARNAFKKHSMASTTKIMTALLALEAGCPEKEIKVTKEMVSIEGTSMGLLEGDSVTLLSLVYGMLLESGNDAANTVAYTLAGNPKKFSKLMNKRAAKIGMKNTNFVTPSGLDNKEHYSTAYDMALLGCEALKNVEFRNVCSKPNVRISYGNPPYMRTLSNHNRLLYSYEGCIGIKTGFTKKSGRCLASAAERDGITLVAVTLNAKSDWKDHKKMLDYGFSFVNQVEPYVNLHDIRLKVVGGQKSTVSVRYSSDISTVKTVSDKDRIVEKVFIKHFEYAPVEEGDVIGSIKYFVDNNVIKEAAIVASESVQAVIDESAKKESDDKSHGFLDKIIRRIKEFFRRG